LKRKTENLNSKILFMEKDLINEKEKPTSEPIVIADECGDSMWDAVLQQEASPNPSKGGAFRVCDLKAVVDTAKSGRTC
jgi:hypothetical protein